MTNPTLLEKLERMQPPDLQRWLVTLFIAGAVVIAAVFGAYAVFFYDHAFAVDSEKWGQFGDFVGGSANPVLGFLTLVAFVLTLLLQNRQLQVSAIELRMSREELEMTRRELERSAKAQELSEAALRAQAMTAERTAELGTLNFLLQTYRLELESLKGQAFMSVDPRAKRPNIVRERILHLERIVDNLYNELTKDANGPGETESTSG
jgi:hypothetical protein